MDSKKDWSIWPIRVFKYDLGLGFGEEDFLKTTRKKNKKIRVRIGSMFLNGPLYMPFTLKDVDIKLSGYKVGVIGTGKKSGIRMIKCPYCDKIQGIKQDAQFCLHCKRKFYSKPLDH